MGFRPAFGKGTKTALVDEESGESGSSSPSSSNSSGTDDEEIKAEDIKFDLSAYSPAIAGTEKSNDKIGKGYLKVPDNNDTGKMINLIFKMYKKNLESQRPKRRGNSRVLMYNEAWSYSEPSLTLGPEWKYSLMMFTVINIC